MKVAWIGLGSMGKPMALAALAGDHSLTGFARRPAEHDAICAAGGRVTADARAAVSDADLVCVNLFSEDQVRAVMLDGGALAAMPTDAILAIHSTVRPLFIREIVDWREDIALLDAGFSGGPADAEAGRLTLMVGGQANILERARPVFACYADSIAHAGPLGSGMALKVINNLMFGAHVAIARDALRLVASEDLDMTVAVQTLLRGSAGSTALRIVGSGGDPQAVVNGISHYLRKDVPIARAGAAGLDLGTLDAATREFDVA